LLYLDAISMKMFHMLVPYHKTSLNPATFYWVPVPRQESEWSYICVIVLSILSLSTIFIFDIGIVRTVWYFISSMYC